MAISTFIYQSRFEVNKPPAIPTVFSQAAAPPPLSARQSVIRDFGFVAPRPAPAFAASAKFPDLIARNPALPVGSPSFVFLSSTVVVTPGSFGQYPSVVRRGVVRGGNIGFVSPSIFTATPSVLGFSQWPVLRLPTPAAIIPQPGYIAPPAQTVPVVFGQYPAIVIDSFVRSSGVGFGSRPPTVTATPSAFGFSQAPEQIKLPARASLLSLSTGGFVNIPVSFPSGSFGQYPSVVRRGVVRGGNVGFVSRSTIAATPTAFGFSQWPEQFAPPRKPGLNAYSFVSGVPTQPVTISFSPSPVAFAKPRDPGLERYSFSFLQIAYTPSAFGFSQQPAVTRLPTLASLLNVGSPGFEFLPTVAATPTAFGFSEWPEQFARPRRVELDAYSFVSGVPTQPVTISFSPSPVLFAKPRDPGLERYSFSFLQIAYTPSAFGFSQQPAVTRLPTLASLLNVGSPGFEFLPTVAATPTAFGFSQWPEQFTRPRRVELDAYSFVSGVPTQPLTISFSPSPVAFAKPRDVGLERYSFAFLQIAYTPSAFGFSQQPAAIRLPTLASLLNVGSPGFEFLPTIAATPTAFGFSQWPEQFTRPRRVELDAYSFVSGVPTQPLTISFSPSPVAFAKPRDVGLERYSFAFLQIAYTPSAFGFSQQPAAIRLPTLASLLNVGAPGFEFIPTVAATPTAFGFSQWPEQFTSPRKPGLDAYSFVSAFRTAVTPTAFGFSQAPEQIKLPARASLLNLNTGGFVNIPPTVSLPYVAFGQYPAIVRRGVVRGGTYSFVSAFRTAATPAPLGFGQAPVQFRLPIPLDVGRPGFAFIPAVATPRPFGFCQYPVAFAKPRMPGLDSYSFVSTFRIAATPFAYGFSPSPTQIKLPTLASLLNAGSLGFVFTPNQTLITVGPIHVIYPHRRPLGHPALDRADEVAAQSRSPNKPAKDRLDSDDERAISRSPNKPAKDRLN